MAEAIAIREKVAALCGFSDFRFKTGISKDLLQGSKDGVAWILIPCYETFLDAINQVFNDNKLTYTLQKGINKKSGDVGYLASHPSVSDTFSDTAAKALCYLFIHLMKIED